MRLGRYYPLTWPIRDCELGVWETCLKESFFVQFLLDVVAVQRLQSRALTHVISPTLPDNPHCVCYHVLQTKYIPHTVSLFCSRDALKGQFTQK